MGDFFFLFGENGGGHQMQYLRVVILSCTFKTIFHFVIKLISMNLSKTFCNSNVLKWPYFGFHDHKYLKMIKKHSIRETFYLAAKWR